MIDMKDDAIKRMYDGFKANGIEINEELKQFLPVQNKNLIFEKLKKLDKENSNGNS